MQTRHAASGFGACGCFVMESEVIQVQYHSRWPQTGRNERWVKMIEMAKKYIGQCIKKEHNYLLDYGVLKFKMQRQEVHGDVGDIEKRSSENTKYHTESPRLASLVHSNQKFWRFYRFLWKWDTRNSAISCFLIFGASAVNPCTPDITSTMTIDFIKR